MTIECGVKARKRKHIDYYEPDSDSEEKEEEEDEAAVVPPELQQDLAEAEAEDLDDLISIASEATEIEFDSRTGRPIRYRRPPFRASSGDDDSSFDVDDDNDNDSSLIDGLVKVSSAMLLEGDPNLFRDLTRIHAIVKRKVKMNDMVPWAGIGGDSTRLRAFGFMGETSLDRLDRRSAVRLHAPEKQGEDAVRDERANRKAICILDRTRERVVGIGRGKGKHRDKRLVPAPHYTVNPTLVADKLCAAILTDKSSGSNNHTNGHLNPNVLCSNELITYQTNLHNGAKHLAAHLDAPLHEGFGKVIVTVAIRGSATILLIGKGDDDNDYERANKNIDLDESSDLNLQPAWKFHLKEGEAYVLSGNVRNVCLHAVLANDDGIGGNRESLNLRFGLHSIEEAEHDIKRHWPDLW